MARMVRSAQQTTHITRIRARRRPHARQKPIHLLYSTPKTTPFQAQPAAAAAAPNSPRRRGAGVELPAPVSRGRVAPELAPPDSAPASPVGGGGRGVSELGGAGSPARPVGAGEAARAPRSTAKVLRGGGEGVSNKAVRALSREFYMAGCRRCVCTACTDIARGSASNKRG